MNTTLSDISRSSLVVVSLSVVAEAATTMAPTPPAPVDVTTTKYMEPVRLVQFNPALASVIMAMVICFFLVGFATGYLKRCIRPAEADAEVVIQRRIVHSGTGSPTSESLRGLDPEILEALPLVQYKDLPADEQVRKYFDCSVCLAAFDANDSLRLLPECSHAFHSDCIDVWFLSHSTCPLCRACLALPTDKASREEHEGNGQAGEQSEIRVPEGFGVLEMVISGNREQDSGGSTAISGFFQDRTGRPAMASSFAAEEEEERSNARFVFWSNVRASFRPAVRLDIAPDEAAALATIRRSNSAGTDLQLLYPSYIGHSEGTQHNRNYLTRATDVEELPKDQDGAQAESTESHYRRPATLAQHWLPVDLEAGASSVTRQISRLGPQRVWSTRWSLPNLRQIAQA